MFTGTIGTAYLCWKHDFCLSMYQQKYKLWHMNHLIIFKLMYCVNKFSVIAKYTEDQTGLHLILMSQMHICVLFLRGPERTEDSAQLVLCDPFVISVLVIIAIQILVERRCWPSTASFIHNLNFISCSWQWQEHWAQSIDMIGHKNSKNRYFSNNEIAFVFSSANAHRHIRLVISLYLIWYTLICLMEVAHRAA